MHTAYPWKLWFPAAAWAVRMWPGCVHLTEVVSGVCAVSVALKRGQLYFNLARLSSETNSDYIII